MQQPRRLQRPRNLGAPAGRHAQRRRANRRLPGRRETSPAESPSKFAADDPGAASAYADYQAIGTEYVVRQTPDADFAKVQAWYIDALNGFVDRYPKTRRGGPGLAAAGAQQGVRRQRRGRVEVLQEGRHLPSAVRNRRSRRKAAGAVRRLESVGKRVDLQGTSLSDGKAFVALGLPRQAGRPALLGNLVRTLQARHEIAATAASPLSASGICESSVINVDQTRQQATEEFLQEAKLPWVQLFEEGGLEASPSGDRRSESRPCPP